MRSGQDGFNCKSPPETAGFFIQTMSQANNAKFGWNGTGRTRFIPPAFERDCHISIANKKGDPETSGSPYNKSGSDLLSHTVTRVVPSAQKGLTAEFGMGSGVTPSL